jgi:hypothetical protein
MQDEEYSKLLRIKNRIDELSRPIDVTSEKSKVEQGETLSKIIDENSKSIVKYSEFYKNLIYELKKFDRNETYKYYLEKLEKLAIVNDEEFKLTFLKSTKDIIDKDEKRDTLLFLLEDSTATTIEPSHHVK